MFAAAGFDPRYHETFRDDEGFSLPPEAFLNLVPCDNQFQYQQNVEELGNPNILFLASKR